MSEPVFQCWPGEMRALVSDGNLQQAGRWLLEAVRLSRYCKNSEGHGRRDSHGAFNSESSYSVLILLTLKWVLSWFNGRSVEQFEIPNKKDICQNLLSSFCLYKLSKIQSQWRHDKENWKEQKNHFIYNHFISLYERNTWRGCFGNVFLVF